MHTSQVNVKRWSITSPKPFDVVVASVEKAIGRPNMIEFIANMTGATSFEEMQNVVHGSVSDIPRSLGVGGHVAPVYNARARKPRALTFRM